jgi:hypothetical protein
LVAVAALLSGCAETEPAGSEPRIEVTSSALQAQIALEAPSSVGRSATVPVTLRYAVSEPVNVFVAIKRPSDNWAWYGENGETVSPSRTSSTFNVEVRFNPPPGTDYVWEVRVENFAGQRLQEFTHPLEIEADGPVRNAVSLTEFPRSVSQRGGPTRVTVNYVAEASATLEVAFKRHAGWVWYGGVVRSVPAGSNTWDVEVDVAEVPAPGDGYVWEAKLRSAGTGELIGYQLKYVSVFGTEVTLEDFEGYSSDSALESAYEANPAASMDVRLSSLVRSGGLYGAEVNYRFGLDSYAGLMRFTETRNWSAYSALRLFLRNDGAARDLTVQIQDGTNYVYWEAKVAMPGAPGGIVTVPLVNFTGNGRFDFTNVQRISYYVSRVSTETAGTFYMDDVRLVADPNYPVPTQSGLVLDEVTQLERYTFNSYGGTIGLALSEQTKSRGAYGLYFHYDLDVESYAGFYAYLNSGSLANYSKLRFWLAPDASRRTLIVQLREGEVDGAWSGEYWEAFVPLTGSTPQFVDLPFSAFQRPPWCTWGNGSLDAGNLEEYAFYVTRGAGGAGSGEIFIDSLEALP